jgi:hypothetical protein
LFLTWKERQCLTVHAVSCTGQVFFKNLFIETDKFKCNTAQKGREKVRSQRLENHTWRLHFFIEN